MTWKYDYWWRGGGKQFCLYEAGKCLRVGADLKLFWSCKTKSALSRYYLLQTISSIDRLKIVRG